MEGLLAREPIAISTPGLQFGQAENNSRVRTKRASQSKELGRFDSCGRGAVGNSHEQLLQ
jgi:hypothetical protein